MIVGLLLVGQMIGRIPNLLYEQLGVDIGGRTGLEATAAIGADTPLGTRVNVPNGVSYADTPNGSEDGTFAPGTALTLAEGPRSDTNNKRWWRVRDVGSGTAGWVPEHVLVREGVGGIGPDTPLGTSVRTAMDTRVWQDPDGITKTGTVILGEHGALTKGPIIAHGSRWWYFDRTNSAEDGWVAEAALVLENDTGWHAGSTVRADHEIDLFDHAGSGVSLGLLAEGEQATIVGNPVSVGGAYWWLVQNATGISGWVPESALVAGGAVGWTNGLLASVLSVTTMIGVIFLGGIIYVTIRTNQIRVREAARIRAAIPRDIVPQRNERWEKVRAHVATDNPSDWRLAIIEADIMLDEIVSRMGYPGMTLGDRLKQANRGDFTTLDAAWEAHRTRNEIAHSGSDFVLTQREARRIIDLYASVFEEFKYI